MEDVSNVLPSNIKKTLHQEDTTEINNLQPKVQIENDVKGQEKEREEKEKNDISANVGINASI